MLNQSIGMHLDQPARHTSGIDLLAAALMYLIGDHSGAGHLPLTELMEKVPGHRDARTGRCTDHQEGGAWVMEQSDHLLISLPESIVEVPEDVEELRELIEAELAKLKSSMSYKDKQPKLSVFQNTHK